MDAGRMTEGEFAEEHPEVHAAWICLQRRETDWRFKVVDGGFEAHRLSAGGIAFEFKRGRWQLIT